MSQKTSIKPVKLSVVLFASGMLAAIVAQLFMLSATKAQTMCIHDEVPYSPGERVGTLLCLPDGTWQRTS